MNSTNVSRECIKCWCIVVTCSGWVHVGQHSGVTAATQGRWQYYNC